MDLTYEILFWQSNQKYQLLVAGAQSSGEFVISQSGIEGGAIDTLGRELRNKKIAKLDFAPKINKDDY